MTRYLRCEQKGVNMNWEDLDIPEYYRIKDAEHNELMDAFSIFMVFVLIVTIGGTVYELVKHYIAT